MDWLAEWWLDEAKGVGRWVIRRRSLDDISLVEALCRLSCQLNGHTAWWQSGLMRKTRIALGYLVPSGASVRIRPTSGSLFFVAVLFCLDTGGRL